jgi:DeoR family fructose operon transcriptional repressor
VGALYAEERQQAIAGLVGDRGRVSVTEVAERFGVTTETVRRDLAVLERAGLLRRVHGGAVPTRALALVEPGLLERHTLRSEAKAKIATAALDLLPDSDGSILVDGGTTTFYLAQELLGQSLQLVTNSLPIANLFINDENVELVLVGGLLYPRYGVLLGPMAEHELGTIHAQTLFISVAGVHDGALYNQNLLLVSAERRMMEQAQQVVLLVDSGKFGQQALARLCGLGDIDVVVTDAGLAPQQRTQVIDAGVQLIVADPHPA